MEVLNKATMLSVPHSDEHASRACCPVRAFCKALHSRWITVILLCQPAQDVPIRRQCPLWLSAG